MSHRSVASIYAASDLFVWPAVNEAYGMALLEAQAAGLAAVAGDAGGVASILRHGETGLLAPEGDAAALGAAAAALLARPQARARMGRRAARRAVARHGIGVAARALDGALRRAVEGAGR